MKLLAILAIIYCTLVSAIPLSELTLGVDICPQLNVKCVKDGDWKHPVGDLGKKPFCREGVRCNQCDISKNTHQCNRLFVKECEGSCEAYGPIPF